MKIALLISTYNWPEALNLVLKSLAIQTVKPDEILIADDGSGEATKKVIELFKNQSNIHLQHLWQEDKGFRKSAVLNKAVAASEADYIIQIDGDCIMHKYFIEDHLAMVRENTYLFGSRVNLKPSVVPEVLEKLIHEFSFFSRSVKNKTRNLRIPFLRNRYKDNSSFSHKTRGCNVSYWRKDFITVNGYDEEMEGWGREDSEFILRLINIGVKGKRLRYGGIVYHIYHVEKSKDRLPENEIIQQRTINEKRVWCENGVDKYLNKK